VALAGGAVPESEAEPLLSHSAGCDACAGELRRALALLSPETTLAEQQFLDRLESSTPGWQRAMAAQLAAGKPKAAVLRMPAIRRAAIPLAAAVLLGAAVLVYRLGQPEAPPLAALVSVYSQGRPFEFRVPGAVYASSLRGMPPSRSAELAESESVIQHRAASLRTDPRWLHAEGLARLLRNDLPAARGSLEQARSADPRDAALLVDLATSYCLGSGEDCRKGIALLDTALRQQPRMAEALFNRALAQEVVGDRAAAVDGWREYLALDPDSLWSREAAEHLNRLTR
jgi:tetratricopeptide (TPR) repeat protein